MLVRERCPMPARAFLPPPAPLPSLPDALRRRSTVFGFVEADAARAAPAGLLRGVVAGLRRITP